MKEAKKVNVKLIGGREDDPSRPENYAVLVASDYVGHATWKDDEQMYEFQTKFGKFRHYSDLNELRTELFEAFNL